MSILLVKAGETTDVRRRIYFDCRLASDGVSPATSEAGGQPQISINGSAWTNAGVGLLVHIGEGRYHADIESSAFDVGNGIESRYKSGSTIETRGDSVRVVGFDPYDPIRLGLASLPLVAPGEDGGIFQATSFLANANSLASISAISIGACFSAGETTVDLDPDEISVDGAYVSCRLVVYGADDVRQHALVTDYDAGTKTATLDRPFAHPVETPCLYVLQSALAVLGEGAGAGGDCLANEVPGIYPSGTAGHALGRIGAARVTTVSPVAHEGTRITIIRGDDYRAADGRALDFIDDSGAWPDLVGAQVAFAANFNDSNVTVAGAVITASGANKTVRVELTAGDTGALAIAGHAFSIRAELSSGRIVTLVRGQMIVLEPLVGHCPTPSGWFAT